MDTLKNVGIASFFILVIMAAVVDVGYGFYRFFDHSTTVAYFNISTQNAIDEEVQDGKVDESEKENRWFIKAQYYTNEKNDGVELAEVAFNTFVDPSLSKSAYNTTVMQYVGNVDNVSTTGLAVDFWDRNWYSQSKFLHSKSEIDSYVDPNFHYYNGYEDLYADWKGFGTELCRNTEMIIRIGDEAYVIQLDGKVSNGDTTEVHPQNLFGGFLFGKKVVTKSTSYKYYTYANVLADIMHGIKTNSRGEGTFKTRIDLSKYFTVIKHFNKGTNHWDDVRDSVDVIKNYSVIEFTYSKHGATTSRQSLAHVVADVPKFEYISRDDIDTTYWQERIIYNLTAKDLSYRYSELLGGYVASLSLGMKNDFNKMPKAEVSIALDLNDKYLRDNKMTVVGLDYNAFENFRLKDLRIVGTGVFTCYDKSLLNTRLQTLTHSRLLNVIVMDGAIATEYQEVVLL